MSWERKPRRDLQRRLQLWSCDEHPRDRRPLFGRRPCHRAVRDGWLRRQRTRVSGRLYVHASQPASDVQPIISKRERGGREFHADPAISYSAGIDMDLCWSMLIARARATAATMPITNGFAKRPASSLVRRGVLAKALSIPACRSVISGSSSRCGARLRPRLAVSGITDATTITAANGRMLRGMRGFVVRSACCLGTPRDPPEATSVHR
jgi:hypothetical protein